MNHRYMDATEEGDAGASAAPEPVTEAPAETVTTTVTEEPPAAGFWPSDWRQKWAGEDEKRLARLGRFASPEAAFDALEASMNRIRSGEIGSPFPKDGKPEEIASWRKERGIPEKPDDYGVEGADEVIKSFLEKAHEQNYTPDQVKSSIEWFKGEQERNIAAREAKDIQERSNAEEQLRDEWGPEYKDNLNRIKGTLSVFPESVREIMANARLQDGTALFNNPDVVRGFMAIANEVNPVGTLVPGGSGNVSQGIDEEIGNIEKFMREHRSEYNKDEKKQSRLRELYVAREKVSQRSLT